MFERYLTDALITHFGHVVENLDADKVRLSAWNGQVVLEDLSLRKNALENFVADCPVEIAYGKVGNLELKIPWTLFKSQLQWRNSGSKLLESNCSIVLTDVDILITPKRETSQQQSEEPEDSDKEGITEEKRVQKEKEVQSLLGADLLQRVTNSAGKSRWSWVQDWVSNLLSTLSVTVRNVHIRYEDPGTSMGFVWSSDDAGGVSKRRYRPAFAVGISLQQFSIKTTESEMSASIEEAQEDEDPGFFEVRHKTAAGENIAIYWDSRCELMSINVQNTKKAVADNAVYYQSTFQILNGEDDYFFEHASLYTHGHTYLLDPISPTVNVKLVSPPSKDADESSNDTLEAPPSMELAPPSSFSVDLPPCKFILARSTLEDTAYIRKSLSVWNQAKRGFLPEASLRRLAKLKPMNTPRQDPKGWWRYANEATIALLRVQRAGNDRKNFDFYTQRRRGWVGLVQALSRRRKYVSLYNEFLASVKQLDHPRSLLVHQSLLEMEDELFAREIVAFRISLYDSLKSKAETIPASSKPEISKGDNTILTVEHRSWMVDEMMQALEREKTNMKNRIRAGQRRASIQSDQNQQQMGVVRWSASFVCRQFALQINDEVSTRSTKETKSAPIIRISSAWIQKHTWCEDGSWDTECALASLIVKDLTLSSSSSGHQSHFPNLIDAKQNDCNMSADDFIVINGIRYSRSLSIVVSRKLEWISKNGRILYDDERGSTTKIQVRILPMEIVYSTLPVEGLSRVLATIKTPELVDDMQRMASAAHNWRERQKRKFLQALAHKHKKIVVDVDVGSPELLIPEDIDRYDGPILAVDLGRLQISNEASANDAEYEFDDQWHLVLSNIQVRSATAAMFISQPLPRKDSSTTPPHQLVEPFSLDFAIFTKIAGGDTQIVDEVTRVHISATLPRLAFNLTSSAMRLVLRLKQQWERRKRETAVRRTSQLVPLSFVSLDSRRGFVGAASPSKRKISHDFGTLGITAAEKKTICRAIRFKFSAPLITLRVSNDIDDSDSNLDLQTSQESLTSASLQTPLVDLAFHGIEGVHFIEEAQNGDSLITFDAKLHSLGAIDLYQKAGKDFALLLSSVPPENLPLDLRSGLSWEKSRVDAIRKSGQAGRKDLVAIEYRSKSNATTSNGGFSDELVPDVLSIWFHELYIEWNPETLAAIQKALRLPPTSHHLWTQNGVEEKSAASLLESDEFFDAEEDEFFDAGSGIDSRRRSLSEASTTSWHQIDGQRLQSKFVDSPRMNFTSSSHQAPQPPMSPFLSTLSPEQSEPLVGFEIQQREPPKPFKVIFELSKLRVSFNKEARHRKLVTAQMDGTSFSYTANPKGGSRTKMRIGNLVFTDPDALACKSLYGQIIGLKPEPDSNSDSRPSSLLEMEIIVNPAARNYTSGVDENEETRRQSVRIDREHGLVAGCNNFIHARFSPMRFVFLEQLWFEIVDYFFEGVIGTEVMGGEKSPSEVVLQQTESHTLEVTNAFLHGSDAAGFNFTRFDISLESPALLFPVAYQSPQFILLQLSNIQVSNQYDSCIVQDDPTVSNRDPAVDRMQWYNNCDIAFQGLRLYSASGRELGKTPAIADVALRWPTGPLALRIIPKWKVACRFDNLDIALRRSEYALVQHILSYNIGELSRHLNEWEALQSIPKPDLEKYQNSIMVKYGYDKKDVAPTTYDITVAVPLLSFSLIVEKDTDKTMAIARCMDFHWTLRKASDLVVEQRLTCDVELVAPSAVSGYETMLSMSNNDTNISSEGITSQEMLPELTYTSKTQISGDNVKTLEIVDPCIYMIVPAWSTFVEFFQDLPEPEFLSTSEIRRMINVGDRWYRIGEADVAGKRSDFVDDGDEKLDWIAGISDEGLASNRRFRSSTSRYLPKFQLRVSLTWPRIILSSTFVPSTRVILRMHHLDYLNTNDGQTKTISRSFFFHDVEVYTVSTQKPIHRIDDGSNSLIHPWSVVGLIEKCNGDRVGECTEHTLQVSGDVLMARAAYSDIIIAIDVCLSVLRSTREGQPSVQQGGFVKSTSAGSLAQSTEKSNSEIDSDEKLFCTIPHKNLYNLSLDGFELEVADDSGRHFAGTQDLIILSLGKFHFCQEVLKTGNTSIRVRLGSLDLFDCLQDVKSPFRTAASSRSGVMGLLSPHAIPTSESPAVEKVSRRKMEWDQYRLTTDEHGNIAVSPALIKRAEEASAAREQETEELIEVICLLSGKLEHQYTVRLRSFAVQWNPSTVIAIQRFLGRLRKDSKAKVSQVYHGDFDDIVATPSMESPQKYLAKGVSKKEAELKVHAIFTVDSFTVCLNKEHQHRRLVELTLSACSVGLDSSEEGLHVDGKLGDLFVWDSDNYNKEGSQGVAIVKQNRNILQVQSKDHRDEKNKTGRDAFLRIRYKTFKKRLSTSSIKHEVPDWVRLHVSESREVDDVLNVSVAAVQFTYLRERTEEILDYLSNGLPGKGMGATSRAAKGFLEKRILTKSFLELSVDSPQVLVPQHESLVGGMMLKLGDVNMKSWFEEVFDSDTTKDSSVMKQGDWWRILSLQLTGFCGGMMKDTINVNDLSSATNPIDLEIILQKPTVVGREISLRGKLSFLHLKLNYSDFVFVQAVVRDNVGRRIDTEAWDNIEKAYWLEEEKKEDGLGSGADTIEIESRQVEYASNARFVRYGKAGKRDRKKERKLSETMTQASMAHESAERSTALEVSFKLDGLSLKLRRDDDVDGIEEGDELLQAFHYDISLLRVQLVEISASQKDTGDFSFCLSLFRLGLFDLGDHGRLVRRQYYSSLPSAQSKRSQRNPIRQPCPFHVLVEGYFSSSDEEISTRGSDDAQLVVNVDRCSAGSAIATGSLKDCELPSDSKVTVAKVVVNNLSVNALIRPFKEIAAFLSCEWKTQTSQVASVIGLEKKATDSSRAAGSVQQAKSGSFRNQGFQLKLVAHYPRVFFLADESDPHSRALVLRGLAVVNLSKICRVRSADVTMMNDLLSRNDTQHLTSLNAQLHSMESYINPDVDEALGFKMRHAEMVGEHYASIFPLQPEEIRNPKSSVGDTLGVALIQPVTTGVEYSELRHELSPTKRSLYVNVEPVSTMVSFEDLQLIETVLNRWSSKRHQHTTNNTIPKQLSSEDIDESVDHFESRRPAKETYSITFRSERLGLGLKAEAGRIVVIDTQNSEYANEIGLGDILVAADGQNFEQCSLDKVVRHLSKCKRPTKVTFERPTSQLETSRSTPLKGGKEGYEQSTGIPESPTLSVFTAEDDRPLSTHHLATCYDVKFRLGMSRGLELERSLCGRFPVVTKILTNFSHATSGCSIDESNAEEIEATFSAQREIRVPRIGAVIVAMNGVSVEEMGVEEAFRRLESLSFQGAERNTYSSISDILQSQVYWLSFMEVDSEVWGKVEEADISTSGIAFSFIDDLNGRDMPLFRAKLSTVKVHVERGMGVEARIVDANAPSLLRLGASVLCRDNEEQIALSPKEIANYQSETVITVSILALCAIDYFHPRIACWEPLMEPSQLYLLFEMLKGTKSRPGQIAVELSDYLLHEQVFRGGVSSTNMESQMLTVNVTDAAAQVFVKASSQWKEWRQSIIVEAEDDDPTTIDEELASEIQSFSSDKNSRSKFSEQDISLDKEIIARSDDQAQRYQHAKRFEAQKAAQAALVFAQKRGADKREGTSAKPFVFRNRTGVSIAFVQQGRGTKMDAGLDNDHLGLCGVGEYAGLEDYDPLGLIEIADKEDARFNMELISDHAVDSTEGRGTKQGSNKIRDYEGRFPNLTVSIQAVSGVSVEPLRDLQVYKVGSRIRHLIVKKQNDTNEDQDSRTQYSIPVVWKVRIEDNRRILTLSTAVRVVSSGFNTPIEVGVRKDTLLSEGPVAQVTSIGFSLPETPFYLPLWLALKLDPVYVHVRPGSEDGSRFCWGETSVLHFGPVSLKMQGKGDSGEIGRWVWKETFRDLTFVGCTPTDGALSAAWLSVFGISSSASGKTTSSNGRQSTGENTLLNKYTKSELNEVISVTVDSGLTIRNMLPMSLEWEVANTVGKSWRIVDSSFQPSTKQKRDPSVFTFDGETGSRRTSLESGQCTEVFASDFCSQEIEARFMGSNSSDWSNWARLSVVKHEGKRDDQIEDRVESVLAAMAPRARQVNIQVDDDRLGVPLTFGVRIVPKMTLPDDPSHGRVYGIEVIIYAELWIRNVTSLPLNFGCPSYQLHEPGKRKSEGFSLSDESLARFTAESALMEIANLLEVGDKGTGLSNKRAAREVEESGEIESLPCQECEQLVEEVFEYIEIDGSTVRRRWWASESYDSYRENVTQLLKAGHCWEWIDESWAIDCVGQAKAIHGGWESCRALFTSAGSFTGNRDFDPAHTFRRRRYFRSRTGHRLSPIGSPRLIESASVHTGGLRLLGGIQAIHQPLTDSFSKEQRKLRRKQDRNIGKSKDGKNDKDDEEKLFKIAIKSGDGTWCSPVTIPSAGGSHGVIRVLATRWPALTRARATPPEEPNKDGEKISSMTYGSACLDSDMFELCYSISDVEGEWGEFSRSMIVSPRFLVQNGSKRFTIELKQTGAPDASLMRLSPGQVKPFYWADFRLPGLVSVRPLGYSHRGENLYRWSGGFDICKLGMVPLRVRSIQRAKQGQDRAEVESLRAIVEVRPSTGGTGINVSFKEEDLHGDGSLFRIENLSTFPIWLAQDGNLANPLSTFSYRSSATSSLQKKDLKSHGWVDDHTQLDGDLIRPNEKFSFALDVPYRQGKYAHRKEASMAELTRIRVALVPLSSRAGIETRKVVGLTTVGDSVRLNPSKIVAPYVSGTRDSLQQIRILGVVSNDGPTRVLKFILISKPAPDVFRNAFEEVSYMSTTQSRAKERLCDSAQRDFTREIMDAGLATIERVNSQQLPGENDAKRNAVVGDGAGSKGVDDSTEQMEFDEVYSFRAEFGGFVFSFVDSVPSEIAVASMRNINALARWSKLRTTEASVIISVGWVQVDNHVPSAPFKVAVRPDEDDSSREETSRTSADVSRSAPLLVVALAFSPKHKSGIVCLRSVTVAPRNLVIALDLAFLVRLQRFMQGLKGHFRNLEDTEAGRAGASLQNTEQKKFIPFPHFDTPEQIMAQAAAFGSENQKLYIQGLTILPCNINLSVAPARALTPIQAVLEGAETAAIHEAVRKGDVLVGSSALLGVRVGRKNKTPLSVVRGVFKSIVVDALLRLDDASLNFSGVGLKNHISTGPQLTTFLLTHYLVSLRQNVPALLGSLAAFGNPLGLIRGVGEGVSDFVNEPVKGLKRSVKELDPSFLVDGVARGTESLARHTVGGVADSASLLTETFSKNMAVLTLDRRYAQKRDRDKTLRLNENGNLTLAGGVESGFTKLVNGFRDGVTGVVKAPMRGAEKRGFEGFAKGVGKGLLGLMVKPIIGISDAATDVMIGVKSTVEKTTDRNNLALEQNQLRPRRPMYGRDKVLRPFKLEDSVAAALMLRTSCGGENYLGHMDMKSRVALFSVIRFILLDPKGEELMAVKYERISKAEVCRLQKIDGEEVWGIEMSLIEGGDKAEVFKAIYCQSKEEAVELCSQIKQGMDLVANDIL